MPPPVCANELERLYAAINDLTAGKSKTSIGFGERQVSYTAADLPALMRLWSLWYRQCGADSGYPDLGAAVERGAPAFVRICD